jgi:hypothetical protein
MKFTTIIFATMAALVTASPTVGDTSPNVNIMLTRDDCKACGDYFNKCRAVSSLPSPPTYFMETDYNK